MIISNDSTFTLPPDELVHSLSEWMKAASDPTRIRILFRLREGECSVSTLVHDLETGQATVSKHLKILRQARIIENRREGTTVIYSIRGETPLEVCQLLCAHLREEQRARSEAMNQVSPDTERNAS